MIAEKARLEEYRGRISNWKNWGPYLSERAWGTVREDYSENGDAWGYFPHDHARSRVYRWNEDGLAGICDRNQYLCFGLGLWNGQDAILKERLFGLTGPEGNHGEDVKEAYFYLDSTPTHSYMKMLYKYPQSAFPYQELIEENAKRGYEDDEFELADTGVFDGNRYFDVFVEYAKADTDDILIKIGVWNRGDAAAPIWVLPQVWFRNTWGWGYEMGPMQDVVSPEAGGKPQLSLGEQGEIVAEHPTMGTMRLYCEDNEPAVFTNNETNRERVFGGENESPFVKDAFHRYVVEGETTAVNPARAGTKSAFVVERVVEAGGYVEVRLRLCKDELGAPFEDWGAICEQRVSEADEFYEEVQAEGVSDELKMIQRQAFAGVLWSKQLYYYDVAQWLGGDPNGRLERENGRNREWAHLHNFDIISMPDKWEYPWYAVWDLAFHCVPLVMLDPDFAKRQLVVMTREWYMHPNGQLPAYEWSFGDVNPPVHAWAAWRVYKIDAKMSGEPDRHFLEAVFHKLLLNFTWWVNRKDADGNNVFQGGFLGLDNISLFDRSHALPMGGHIDQSDGTAWMGFYSLGLMRIALELAKDDPVYQDLATKFFEHFLSIAVAMDKGNLWDEEDRFFYDVLHMPDGSKVPLKVRSLVGLMPLLAVEVLDEEVLEQMPIFKRRMAWFVKNRPHLSNNIASLEEKGNAERIMLSIITKDKLTSVLKYMLDESEFLSDYGIRSLSKVHEEPYSVSFNGEEFGIGYDSAESRSGLFGGNSNWRGPIWFPINYLLIESLQKYHHYYGEDFKVEYPSNSGIFVTLNQIATALSKRLIKIFEFDTSLGIRPVNGFKNRHQNLDWENLILFYEYFHGDNGSGLGASHQTGWTALIAKLIQQSGR